MTEAVLDTSVASLVFRNSPTFAPYNRALAAYKPVLAFQTVAEMRFGSVAGNWGQQRLADLESFLANFDVCSYTDELAKFWERVMIDARNAGRRLESGDAWIAATAVLLNAPLFTHAKDFSVESVPSVTVYCFAV